MKRYKRGTKSNMAKRNINENDNKDETKCHEHE